VKLLEITIEPQSDFATPLKGDTLFGHFCWQVAYDRDLVEGGLSEALARYDEQPFAVFSSAFPFLRSGCGARYALPRPQLPLSWLFPDRESTLVNRIARRKALKARRWMLVDGGLSLGFAETAFVNDPELWQALLGDRPFENDRHGHLVRPFEQPHNTIHRLTQTTGKGPFAPHAISSQSFHPQLRLVLFVVIDPSVTDAERICSGLTRIGQFGFGRDASTGKGRFAVDTCREIDTPDPGGCNALYTLSPSVPETGNGAECFFSPFVRYGRHGDVAANSPAPFKAPVVMADEAAVFLFENGLPMRSANGFLGRSVHGISRIHPDAVHQGFAPCLPFKLELNK
jgi:CRISPR-associated protein Csm4